MEKKEIKVKSYLYMQQNITIGFTILFGLPTVAIAIWQRPFSLGIVLSLGLIALFFLLVALTTRLGCRTYDIYNGIGIKRIRGHKIIFEIGWDNVKSALYQGIGSCIVLTPFVLTIWLNEPLKSNENRSYDDTTSISSPMSKNTLKKVLNYIPVEVKNKPKGL